jgi:hypothetical protein
MAICWAYLAETTSQFSTNLTRTAVRSGQPPYQTPILHFIIPILLKKTMVILSSSVLKQETQVTILPNSVRQVKLLSHLPQSEIAARKIVLTFED